MKPMKTVAACVVTYNRRELLLECIDHLLAQTVAAIMDVIIVDNASTDGTQEALADHIAKGNIIYVNTGSNLGGAGGFQRCFREATQRGYEYAWVMDDDCMPEANALEELLVYGDALGGDFGYLSSKVLWKDGSICVMNVQRQKLFKNVEDYSPRAIPIDLASFVSLFVPTSVVREVGLPIKEFFLWTDDWEYTRRISLKHPCYLVPSSVVVHKSAMNIGANIAYESSERLDRFEMMYRNDVYLYRREGVRGFLYECARLTAHAARVITRSSDHRGDRLRSIARGTMKGFGFRPEIEYVD